MHQLLRTSLRRGLGLAVGLLAVAALPAQVVDDANAGIQLSFSTPGARSLGMAGAFLALADDPSAAVSNPAGLVALDGYRVGFEARDSKYTHLFTDTGHGYGPPSYYGLDTVEELRYGHDFDNLRTLSNLSFAWGGDSWGVAVYRHLPIDFTATYMTEGAWVGEYSHDPAFSTIDRLYPASVDFDLAAVTYGVAAAFELGNGFSVGGGVAYWQLELDSLTRHFFFSHDTTPPPPGQVVLAPSFYASGGDDPEDVFSSQAQHADDDGLSYSLGLLWRASDTLSIGAAYRQGTEYDLEYTRTCGPRYPLGDEEDEPEGVDGDGRWTCTPASAAGKFAVPTVYGIGFAFKPTPAMTLTLDWDRVAYSEMTEDVVGPPEVAGEAGSFRIDDASEVRIGVEYVFRNLSNPFSIRGGLWLDPAHQMGYGGASQDLLMQAAWAAAGQAEDEEHFSAGVGWLIANHLTLDLGFDVSDRVDTVAFEAGYRF